MASNLLSMASNLIRRVRICDGSNKKLLETSATLLVTKGIATNGVPGIATGGSWPYYERSILATSNKSL